MRPLITLSSDFGPGNIGTGAMEAVIYEICSEAHVVHFCHTIPGFDIQDGARTLEGVAKIPKGFHVCVVDPGVGMKRRGIIIETRRGDFLIGPDNGVLRPAAEFLGGVVAAFELSNEVYQRKPVSPIFHGRDVFAPAAAHLAAGVPPEKFGPKIDLKTLIPSPYGEAQWRGNQLECLVLHINENGSLFVNVRTEAFGKNLDFGDIIILSLRNRSVEVPYQRTFGEVPKEDPVILNDDFGRVEIAINQGNFAFTFECKRGDKILLRRRS